VDKYAGGMFKVALSLGHGTVKDSGVQAKTEP
jgi:hypothetical protein